MEEILKEIHEYCGNECCSCQCCPEESCVLYRIERVNMTNQQAIDEIENQVCDGCESDCYCCAFKMAKDVLKEQEDKK